MLIPISHDNFQSRRWPWVTIAIILVNLLVFAFTLRADNDEQHALDDSAREVLQYFVEHPYLDPTPPIDTALPRLLADQRIGPKIEAGRNARVPAAARAEEQQELDRLCAALNDIRSKSYIFRYGFVPAKDNWLAMLTSQFLHSGYMHILFNLWFLWLVGVNMEDKWGRVVFPFFYLSAGVAACLAHKVYAPESPVPLVGASGAIAGAMGAFLIGFARAKIRFFFLFIFRPVFFSAPAYLMLPLWLVVQAIYAYLAHGVQASGVAYAAHVGGFVYGVGFAFMMRMSKVEKQIDEAIENHGAVLQDPRILRAAAMTDGGDARGAILALEEIARSAPASIDVQLELLRAAKVIQDRGREVAAYGRLIALYLREEAGMTAVDLYFEMAAAGLDKDLTPGPRLRIARELEKMGQVDRAMQELAKIHARGANDAFALQALVAHAQALTRLRRCEEALDLYAVARTFPDVPLALSKQIEDGAREANGKNTSLSMEHRPSGR